MSRTIIVIFAALTFLLSACDDNSTTPAALQSIRAQVTPQAKPTPKDGIAFAVLLDTSGSMEGNKLRVAKQSVLTIVQQAADFSIQRHVPVEMTVYHFAALPEIVIPMGKPDPAAAADKINSTLKEAGWAIYPAADGTQLHQTLDQIVGGQILLEK
jgi:hypothetical protein